jgi:hypothetical protein
VRRVNPGDLSASFGAGYRFNSMTLSITEEPVTDGVVHKVLGWLTAYPEQGLSPPTGRTTDIPFSRRVSYGDLLRH